MPPKKPKSKPSKPSKPSKSSSSTPFPTPTQALDPALPPSRVHSRSYHYPQLLDEKAVSDALLKWFQGVEENRSMPWRKEWIDPGDLENRDEELGAVLAKRAYEVWVSEVMLQQTRVSTVIPYFNTWIAKWPSIQDLAEAQHDDVLNVWKGLGYYSRATRLHEGAKAMIAKYPDSTCPIPKDAVGLQEFPGIGRYTAGAISSIAFGVAEPVLDGNVMRVLSRQLGLYLDIKDKKSTDVLWDVADQLIKRVAASSEKEVSKIPGQWNQALMELGSTVCTPQPRCAECPVQSTCRVYKEGEALSNKQQAPTAIPDIEDACTLCDVLDPEDLATAPDDNGAEDSRPVKKRKVPAKQSNTLSSYFSIGTPKSNTATDNDDDEASDAPGKRKRPVPNAKTKKTANYCALFPKKSAKKVVAEEACAVCIIELCNGKQKKWLIEQRPAKGLLASLWQFPQTPLPPSCTTPSAQKSLAQTYIHTLALNDIDTRSARCVATFPPLLHVFTHLKLTMHAYRFRVDVDVAAGDADLDVEMQDSSSSSCAGGAADAQPKRKWVSAEEMHTATLSTGMRRCWEMMDKNE